MRSNLVALGVVEVDQGVVSGLVGEEEGSWDQMIGRSYLFHDHIFTKILNGCI